MFKAVQMKSLLFLLFTFLLLQTSVAQQNHFVYIQTENKQPFYVKFDKKVISSSVSGYLIIPRLVDGQYNFTVGFPQNEWEEQNFACTVSKKDQGFLLKNFGDKGWGFFNLQTLDVTMANVKSGEENKPGDSKADEFSTMLSAVVNDPSIKQAEPLAEKAPDVQPVEEPKPVVVSPPSAFIKKELVKTTGAGQEIVYIDSDGNSKDTITIFLDIEKPALESKSKDVIAEDSVAKVIPEQTEKGQEIIQDDKSVNTKNEQEKVTEAPKETKFLNIEVPPPSPANISDSLAGQNKSTTSSEPVVQKPAMVNSDCKAYATDEDFLKLRKKMVSAGDNEDKMIEAAKKVFKSKCFTTEQVKNLGVLFLKDSGKYSFYDVAYPFVSDSHNYGSLVNQLTDPYYINRFKVMVRL